MQIPISVADAVAAAVHHAISIVGIDGLRATSMFPSSRREGLQGTRGQDWGG